MKWRLKNSSGPAKNPAVTYFIALLAAVAVYTVSCAPGVLWQDSGMYQYRIWHHDIEGKLGLALSHPLYHIIGMGAKHINFGDFAYRINLVSAIAGAVTIANFFWLLRLWLRKMWPAVMAAITLALSHTLWLHASIAEVYTLYTALFTAELIFLLQYIRSRRVGYLYFLGLFNGLAIAVHMWAVIGLVCYLVFLTALLASRQIKLKHFGVIVLLWIIGAGSYEYLIIKNIIETGDFTATIASAFFGESWQGAVLNTSLSAKLVEENLVLTAYNFPTPNALFFFLGLYGLKKVSPGRSFTRILAALLILFFVFAFRYTVPDRFAFFIPFYCLAAAFMGVGIHIFLKHHPRKLYTFLILSCSFLPLPIYKFAPITAEKLKVNLGTKRVIPYRHEYRWFLQPWKISYNGPEQFAKEALAGVEKEAIIFADGTTVYPLWYVQEFRAINAEVRVVSGHRTYHNPIAFPSGDTMDKLIAERAVYVVTPAEGYCPRFLLERYKFAKRGVLWKLTN